MAAVPGGRWALGGQRFPNPSLDKILRPVTYTLVVERPAKGRRFKPSSRRGEFSSSCRGLEENCLPEPSLKLKSVDLASAEEEEDLMVSKGKERAMKLTSLHTLPREIHSVGHLVWAGE